MKKSSWIALFAFLFALINAPETSANQKVTYMIGETGPSGGYIAYVDDFDEYSWDYLEVSPPKWSTPSYGYGAIRPLPFGRDAKTLVDLSWKIGSGTSNTEKIVSTHGRGWDISRISKDSTDCKASNCKVTVELKTPHNLQGFPTGIETPILPIMCAGKLTSVIVNTGDLFISGPQSFYFYDNVATRNIVNDIATNTGCKITYLALAADEAVIGGSADWFLPSVEELTLIQKNLMTNNTVFDQYNSSYAASNFKDANTVYHWGFNYKSDPNRVGARLLVDIKYSYLPIFARTFSTSSPVVTKGFPKSCPDKWDANSLVDVTKLANGNASGALEKISEVDKFEVIAKWTLQSSSDGTTFQDTQIIGKPEDMKSQALVVDRMQGMARAISHLRYSVFIEKKGCTSATIYSKAINYQYMDTTKWKNTTQDLYVKQFPSLFPTFKEVDQLNRSIIDIRNWFKLFNEGGIRECYSNKGVAGLYLFPEGHLFGCPSQTDFTNGILSNPAVVYDWRQIRVAPYDSISCKVDDSLRISEKFAIRVITSFGQPRGVPGYFVSSKTKCLVGIFLYDSWGWQWLENIELNDRTLTDLKAKQEAEAKAAAELKAKQEAEAKAAAELKAKQEAEAKAAAELKAKQEAEAKAAAELKAKQEAAAKAAAELKAKQEAEAKAAAELKAKQEAEAKAAAELKAKQEAEAKAAADLKAKQEAEAKAAADLKAKQEAAAKAALMKKTTITCIKGKTTKKVTALKPVCPAGYKKK